MNAIYMRASSKQQETVSQVADLKVWEGFNGECEWYQEKISGKDFNRSEWQRLWSDVENGKIKRVVVWRLDRLGRGAAETIRIMDELERRGVAFWSIRDGFDPSTPAGRLTRNVLASVAQFETEVRRERQMAGIMAKQQAVRDGLVPRYGTGWRKGVPKKLSPEMIETVCVLKAAKTPVRLISEQLGLSRDSIYRALKGFKDESFNELS